MIRIDIKPLSVNAAWKGQRFKTNDYKAYEKELLYTIKKIKIPEGDLQIHLIFGVSSKGGDWDNPIKPIVDVLQKKHLFDDNRIYKAIVEKVIVPKGKEFIEYKIESYVLD